MHSMHVHVSQMHACKCWVSLPCASPYRVHLLTMCVCVSFFYARLCACGSGLPIWRRLLYFGFFSIGAVLNLMWGYKLFQGALKILTAKSA